LAQRQQKNKDQQSGGRMTGAMHSSSE
jgi:hypothetical protein